MNIDKHIFLQGFNEMVNSGKTKIIFILLPGVKEFLNQHSKENDTYAAVQRALKVKYYSKFLCRMFVC